MSARHPDRDNPAEPRAVLRARVGPDGESTAREGEVAVARDEASLVVERPLEIRVGDRPLLVTMRTPGHDLDLARGVLFSEGLVGLDDIVSVAHCEDVPEEARGDVVVVGLREGAVIDEERAKRTTLVAAACGVCGKADLESLRVSCPPVEEGPRVPGAVLAALPRELRGHQAVFDATGGLHAAGLFDAAGRLLSAREDVGRHNAVDKVVGEALRFGRVPLRGTVLVVSGRAGFEIVLKARRAGMAVIVSVSAPSTLAVDLAREGGQTLVGFARGSTFNVYCGARRVADVDADPELR